MSHRFSKRSKAVRVENKKRLLLVSRHKVILLCGGGGCGVQNIGDIDLVWQRQTDGHKLQNIWNITMNYKENSLCAFGTCSLLS